MARVTSLLLAGVLITACASPITNKKRRSEEWSWRCDLEEEVNAAPKENPIVIAYDHPGGWMTKCFWSYRVLIHQDGTVDFTGRAGVRREGDFHWSMPRDRLDAIMAKFDPLWDAPLVEAYGVIDAGENCLYVANGGRHFLKCFIGWRGGTEPFYAFAHYVTFKTNAVQWMGEPGERDPDCRPRSETPSP